MSSYVRNMDDRAPTSDSSNVSVPSTSSSLNKRRLSPGEDDPRPSKRIQRQPQREEEHTADENSDHDSSKDAPHSSPGSAADAHPSRHWQRVLRRGPETADGNQSSYFQNAQNLAFHSPTVVDGQHQVYINQGAPNRDALQWLQTYYMAGAEHDSFERDPPPRCHPSTRTSIIGRSRGWFQGSQGECKLLWLHGPAGVGKSAIVQTMVESLVRSRRLGASIFFSPTHGRTSSIKVFPTIAYQLALRDQSYKSYVEELMTQDPGCLGKTMGEQFHVLIIEPFVKRKVRNGSDTWLIALDGLDECGDGPVSSGPSRHREQVQCEIIHLISQFILSNPSVPLKWLIASRPEPHLKAFFYRERVKKCLTSGAVPVDSTEGCLNVERYLYHKFNEIRQSYPEFNLRMPWPSSRQFLAIATAAKGLFVFAFVVIAFIGDPTVGNPVAQLNCVLTLLDQLALSPQSQNPLSNLDAMYIQILRRISVEALPTTKRILGACIVMGKLQIISSQIDLCLVCNVLGISHDAAMTALRQLQSVLQIDGAQPQQPTPTMPRRPLFYHASFQDFLVDQPRSREYWIDRHAIGVEFFWLLLEYKLEKLAWNDLQRSTQSEPDTAEFSGIPLSWPPSPAFAPELCSRMETRVEEAWTSFLGGSSTGQVFKFTYSHVKISLSPLKLITILERLDFDKMFGETRVEPPRFWFLWHLCKTEFFKKQLEKADFLTFGTLVDLDVERLVIEENDDLSDRFPYAVFRCIKDNPSGDTSPANPPKKSVEQLHSWAQEMPHIEVRILGRREGERCALFAGPKRTGQSTFYVITGL